jgi:hypothetical protein
MRHAQAGAAGGEGRGGTPRTPGSSAGVLHTHRVVLYLTSLVHGTEFLRVPLLSTLVNVPFAASLRRMHIWQQRLVSANQQQQQHSLPSSRSARWLRSCGGAGFAGGPVGAHWLACVGA